MLRPVEPCKGTHLQVPDQCGKALSTPDFWRLRRARTLISHPPPTVEKQQACSTSRWLQRQTPDPAGAWSRRQALLNGGSLCKGNHLQVPDHHGGKHSPSPKCWRHRRARTFESASASHRGAAASLLDQSKLHGGFRCKGKHLQVPDHGGKHSPPPKCWRQRPLHTSRPTPHRTVEQPHACFDQSNLAKAHICRYRINAAKHSPLLISGG